MIERTKGTIRAKNTLLDRLDSPTYRDVQGWSDATQSAGVIDGGLITDGGSGTIDISTIKGIIKTTNSIIGANLFFDLTSVSAQALTDDSENFIAIDYNSGTPQFVIGVTNIANGHTIFNLGKVFREGTSLDIINSGLNIYDFSKRVQQHHVEESMLHFVSGAAVSETGTRNIAVTAGVMYAGLNRIITDAIDTNVADTFEYYYFDGADWIESDETQISNTQYNDITTGLENMVVNKYNTAWVYKGTNATTFVVYGRLDSTLVAAQAEQPYGNLPDHVADFGVLRAKIIIQAGNDSFIDIQSVDDVQFTSTTTTIHNELFGLQGGVSNEYYHATSAEYDILQNTSGTNTGDEAAASTTVSGVVELATIAETDTGTDTTRALTSDGLQGSKRNIRWLTFNLVEAGTDCATATNIAGDFVSPIAGTILQSDTTPFYLYATNSTAGINTGTGLVVDISIDGTTIMDTNKLDFDTTEKTTTTAGTPPDLTTTALAVGDIITIDIDSIHDGTAAKGLTVYMAVRED